MTAMEDRVILITGGAGGIGAEISARLASRGARVIIADVNLGRAQGKAADIVAAGGQALGASATSPTRNSASVSQTLPSLHSGTWTEW